MIDPQLLDGLTNKLRLAGIEDPEREARLLAGHVNEHFAEDGRHAAIEALIERRTKREATGASGWQSQLPQP